MHLGHGHLRSERYGNPLPASCRAAALAFLVVLVVVMAGFVVFADEAGGSKYLSGGWGYGGSVGGVGAFGHLPCCNELTI